MGHLAEKLSCPCATSMEWAGKHLQIYPHNSTLTFFLSAQLFPTTQKPWTRYVYHIDTSTGLCPDSTNAITAQGAFLGCTVLLHKQLSKPSRPLQTRAQTHPIQQSIEKMFSLLVQNIFLKEKKTKQDKLNLVSRILIASSAIRKQLGTAWFCFLSQERKQENNFQGRWVYLSPITNWKVTKTGQKNPPNKPWKKDGRGFNVTVRLQNSFLIGKT